MARERIFRVADQVASRLLARSYIQKSDFAGSRCSLQRGLQFLHLKVLWI